MMKLFTFTNTVYTLGVLSLLILAIKFSIFLHSSIYVVYFSKPIDLKKRYMRRGAGDQVWAVVTGATSGIGLGFCKSLAERGLNVLMVSRSLQKLESVSDDLKKQFPSVEFRICQSEYTNRAQCDLFIDRILEAVRSLPKGCLAVLINNLGVSTDYPKLLVNISDSEMDDMLEVNCRLTCRLTKYIIPEMIQRNDCERRGLIIKYNVAL